jgi:tRNA pseudouridine32 synthase/23S rRNA pseudouridine746 synthase
MRQAVMTEAFSRTWTVTEASTASDLLARLTGLPKARVKDCMVKGGVWRHRPGHRTSRLRRATSEVLPGERLELNYDPALLALVPPRPELVENAGRWSVWHKPAGVLSQGTRFADHCSMPRLAQTILGAKAEFHPVHRLDREARGLILLAHDGAAAAALGGLFRRALVDKEYVVVVMGMPAWSEMTVEEPLDGQACRSDFRVMGADAGAALLSARIVTGRRHQIRRHLAGIGHPVLGDPRYGRGNSCAAGLQLVARSLSFTCPFTRRTHAWSLPAPDFPVPSQPASRG